MPASALSRCCSVLALLSPISTRRRSSLTASGASDVVSTPPAMPDSIWPEGDLVGDQDGGLQPGAAGLLDVVRRGGRRDSREPSTLSRVRLKSRECLRTAPATTSPTCSPCSPKRATSPSRVGGEHVLVGRLRVGGVGAGERDAVAADDRGLRAGCHRDLRVG